MKARSMEGCPLVTAEGDGLRVTWADGHSGWFHYVWLRENCRCAGCTHPVAWERTVSFASIPLDLTPENVEAAPSALRLEWPEHGATCDGTSYSWSWLDDHRTEPEARQARERVSVGVSPAPGGETLGFPAIMSTDKVLQRLIELILDRGFAIVSAMPNEPGSVLSLAERIAFVEESHFGRWFDVESKPNPENLAYTAHSLPPHNDLPSRRSLPGVQLLHALCNDAVGGESILVDGVALAERLRRDHPQSFDVLAGVPVRFTSVGDTWQISNRAPVIDVDDDGEIVGTRFHPALIGPIDVEPALVGDFYLAHRIFLEQATDPNNQIVFRLETGHCQIFDNQRMLHARREFDPSSGKRHLQGCYVNRDDLESRLHVLRRDGRDFRTDPAQT